MDENSNRQLMVQHGYVRKYGLGMVAPDAVPRTVETRGISQGQACAMLEL